MDTVVVEVHFIVHRTKVRRACVHLYARCNRLELLIVFNFNLLLYYVHTCMYVYTCTHTYIHMHSATVHTVHTYIYIHTCTTHM
jgi:hypothetical protein